MPTPYEKLVEYEARFLLDAGWSRCEDRPGFWLEPEACGEPRRELEHGHAFNSEWLHGRARDTHTRAVRYGVLRAQEVYLLESGWALKLGDDVAEGKLPDEWTEPSGRHAEKRIYRRFAKAVNSQKAWDRNTMFVEED